MEEHLAFLQEAAKSNLINFAEIVKKGYTAEPFHEIIGTILQEAIEKVQRKEKVRIILSVPPRMGKTELASILFPAWALGKYPTTKFILSSYGADLSETIGMKTRDIINSEPYQMVFPGVTLRPDVKAKAKWMTTQGGSFTGVGMGTAVTGIGADCVVPYCNVYTNHGIIPILKVKSGDLILGYDHKTNTSIWTRVRAVSARLSDKRIIRAGSLEATEDHRIFTREKGYIPISQVTCSERVVMDESYMSSLHQKIRSEDFGSFKEDEERPTKDILFRDLCSGGHEGNKKGDKKRLSDMWKKESKTCFPMYGMLQQGTKSKKNKLSLRRMWSYLCETSIRNRQIKSSGAHKDILFSEMLYRRKKEEGIKTQRNTQMYSLWKRISEFKKVLFSKVLCRVPFFKRWGWGLQQEMAGFKNVCLRTGQSDMPIMRQDESKNEHPSSGRGSFKSGNIKSSDAVCGMSSFSSQSPSVSAGDIAEIHDWKDYVVDIQTDTHNFFCEGILVSNCIIIDDPHKDRAEAESEVVRNSVWEYYRSTLYSRLEGYGAVIIIMQRWHLDDLVGKVKEESQRLKEAGGSYDEWEIINFPAIAEEDEFFRGQLIRKKGESLWPSKFPLEVLDNIKQTSGIYNWYSQYAQDPIATEAQEFKEFYFRYFEEQDLSSKRLRYYTLVDPAISQKTSADNTVVLTIAKEVEGPNIYRVREDAGHFTPEQTLQLIFAHQADYRSEVAIEVVQYQMALKYSVIEEQRKRQIYFTVHEIKSSTNKESRIRGLLPLYSAGVIFHRKGDIEFERELLSFPRGKRDDRCIFGGTLINTLRGNVPIKEVKVGDYVLTRKGYKKVLASSKTGYEKIITKFGLSATPDHPVYTERGWVSLDSVRESDILIVCKNQLFGMGKNTDDTPILGQGVIESIFRDESKVESPTYIESYGNSITEKSQKGFTSTTKTKTAKTMLLRTLNVLALRNIMKYTKTLIVKGWSNSSQLLKFSKINGLIPKKVKSGYRYITGEFLIKLKLFLIADFVVKPLKTYPQMNSTFVGHDVQESGIETKTRELQESKNKPKDSNILPTLTWFLSAKDVTSGSEMPRGENLSSATNAKRSEDMPTDIYQELEKKQTLPVEIVSQYFRVTARELSSVLKNVPTLGRCVDSGSVEDVYNLQVEDANEYFANGILVHNCDAMSMWLLLDINTSSGTAKQYKPHWTGYGRKK